MRSRGCRTTSSPSNGALHSLPALASVPLPAPPPRPAGSRPRRNHDPAPAAVHLGGNGTPVAPAARAPAATARWQSRAPAAYAPVAPFLAITAVPKLCLAVAAAPKPHRRSSAQAPPRRAARAAPCRSATIDGQPRTDKGISG